jgi:hypothetical protein
MVLRFQPNRGTESQLAIRALHDGGGEGTLYTIQGDSAWTTANRYVARTGQEQATAIAGTIKVKKRDLSLARADLEKWHALLFDVVRGSESTLERSAEEYRTNGTRSTVLDGDRYDFWYVQGETESHWSFSDVPLGDAPRQAILPLAKWMAMVRAGGDEKLMFPPFSPGFRC